MQAKLDEKELKKNIKNQSVEAVFLAESTGKFTSVDRLIAAHEKALPETLSKLSHSSDVATRRRVVSNPNTPTEDFIRLGQQFSKEFLSNPLLDMLLLEDPRLLEELPEPLLISILKRPSCPEDFLAWASKLDSEKVQLAVVMNPTLSKKIKRGSYYDSGNTQLLFGKK